MRTVTYKSVIDRIAGYMGEFDGLDVEDAALANAKINFFVKLSWEHFWWPEVMAIEQRTFRPRYASVTAYAAGDQVFFPATGNYYQALQASTGNAPATLVGSGYVTNNMFWVECQASYSGNDFAADQVYAVTNIARNPDDGAFYQVHTLPINVTGAGVAAANGIYQPSGTVDLFGRALYVLNTTWPLPALATGAFISFSGQWNLSIVTAGVISATYVSAGSQAVATPDLVTDWTSTDIANNPVPTVAPYTLLLAPPSASWGLLVPFIRSLEYEQTGETPLGETRYLWTSNPETNPKAIQVGGGRGPDFRLRDDFLQVLGTANVVWVEFRLRPNVYTGAIRSDSLGYGAGVTLYDVETGDYWTTLESVSAGESPTTAVSSWSRVEFPYIFAEFVAQSAYAMLTNKDQETPENFTIQMAAGYPLLLAELDKIERQQGQSRQLHVVSGRHC